ncbi:MAG TPA: dihydrodipicolinate reductase [Anaerolineae bacterium]
MSSKKIKVILFGLGPIGLEIARVIAARPAYEIVGAIDIDPEKVGRDLGEVAGVKEKWGVVVSGDAKTTLKKRAAVVVHATGSTIKQVLPQLLQIIATRHNIVSTCEELANPWLDSPADAKKLDRLAKERRVALVGTGINPGYAMDTLPVMLTGVCQEVKKIRVKRIVDASKRRMQLQKKIGTGMTVAEFKERAAKREIRHVGLAESVGLIARGMGWKLDKQGNTIEPVVAAHEVRTDHYTVPTNFVTGVRQTAFGTVGGERVIELELLMSVDAGPSSDEVWIEGTPSVHARIGGIHGDLSTAAIVANAIQRIIESPPGLKTMVDLPVISAR